MEEASANFYNTMNEPGISSADPRCRIALFLLLATETRCYRY